MELLFLSKILLVSATFLVALVVLLREKGRVADFATSRYKVSLVLVRSSQNVDVVVVPWVGQNLSQGLQ